MLNKMKYPLAGQSRILSKKNLIIIFFFLSLTIFFRSSNAQQWVQQNVGNWTNIRFSSVYFINENTGIAVGNKFTLDSGIIVRTTNGGYNWYLIQTAYQLRSGGTIHFPSVITGYIAAEGGFYKTTNSGVNFTFNNPGFYFNSTACFFTSIDTGYMVGGSTYSIVKTTNGGTVWSLYGMLASIFDIYFTSALTGYLVNQGQNGCGIYGTTNAGLNWNLQCSNGNFYAIRFPSASTGYCAGYNTCVKTTNGGQNWIPFNNPDIWNNDVFFISDNTGYFLGHPNTNPDTGSIYKTTNGGINWQTQVKFARKLINSIFFPSGNKVGYAVGDSGLILKTGLVAHLENKYLYNDGRIQTHNLTFSDSSCYILNGTIDSLWWYINGIRVNPSASQPQHTMIYSYKQGTTYVQLKIKDSNGFIDSTTAKVVRAVYLTKTNGPIKAGLSLIGDDFLYARSTGNAVYRMGLNGDTLYTLQTAGNILSSCSISYDTCVYICSDNTNLYGFSKSGVPIWSLPIFLGAPATCTPTIDSISNRLYVGVANKKFFAINRQAGNIAWFYDTINSPIRNSAVVSIGRKLVFASESGFIYGFDLNNLPTPPYPKWKLNLNDSVITSPAIDAQGYFYFGTRSGKLVKVDLPSSSTNGSIVWQANLNSPVVSSPTIDVNGNIYCGTNDGNLYCVRPGGSIKWNYLSTGSVSSTAAITRSMIVYFGNDAGELIGLDTNKNVQFYYKDSSNISCAILYKSGTTYIGTETGRLLAFYDTTAGVYDKSGIGGPIWGTFQNNVRRTGSQQDGGQSIGIQKITTTVPDKYKLFQNYPNPFNPETKIKFSIPKNEFVTLKIYDVLGRMVKTLVGEKLEAGEYEIKFLNNQLSSGVYYYKMQAGNFEMVKKMVILK